MSLIVGTSRAVSGSLFLAAMVIAQPPPPPTPPGPGQPLLRGPEVTDRDVPGVVGTFGNSDQKRRFAERIPPQVFREALEVLIADDAPAEVRATPAQQEKVEEMIASFEREVRAYMREHRQELSELRRAAGELREGRPGRNRGGPDDGAMREPMANRNEKETAPDADREAARRQLRELMEGAPQPDQLMTRIWAELSEPQREAVEKELDVFRAAQARQREDQYVRQKVGDGQSPRPRDARTPGENMDPARPDAQRRIPEGGPGRGAGLTPERRERLIRIFERMSPERQEQILTRIERMLSEEVAPPPDRPGRRGANGRGQPKPPPGVDEVQVPSSPDDSSGEPPRRRGGDPEPR